MYLLRLLYAVLIGGSSAASATTAATKSGYLSADG